MPKDRTVREAFAKGTSLMTSLMTSLIASLIACRYARLREGNAAAGGSGAGSADADGAGARHNADAGGACL
jgi:hypothetical protein